MRPPPAATPDSNSPTMRWCACPDAVVPRSMYSRTSTEPEPAVRPLTETPLGRFDPDPGFPTVIGVTTSALASASVTT